MTSLDPEIREVVQMHRARDSKHALGIGLDLLIPHSPIALRNVICPSVDLHLGFVAKALQPYGIRSNNFVPLSLGILTSWS